jgi:putative flippase GtrA
VLHHGAPLPAATATSYLVAISIHFTLNRYFNFRRFDRSVVRQSRTYLIVVACELVLTVGVVQVLAHVFGLPPVAAKIGSVVLDVPLGFLGHRYATFAGGIQPLIRGIATRWSASQHDRGNA